MIGPQSARRTLSGGDQNSVFLVFSVAQSLVFGYSNALPYDSLIVIFTICSPGVVGFCSGSRSGMPFTISWPL